MSATSLTAVAPSPRRGFTLLELLVSMGIISLLAVMLIPVVPMARRHARDAKCKSNLTQIWKTMNIYANNHDDILFSNLEDPLLISNVAYRDGQPTGLGCMYPLYLREPDILYCPADQVRDPKWERGWANWGTPTGIVELSYGYRGGHGIQDDPNKPIRLALIDAHPKKVFVIDYYEPFQDPPRVHHPRHINMMRGWGKVDQMNVEPSFGPNVEDLDAALALVDQ